MIRTFSFALLCVLVLTACNGQKTPPLPPQIEDPAILSDPFATLIPWDAERKEVQTTASGLQYLVLSAGDSSGTIRRCPSHPRLD